MIRHFVSFVLVHPYPPLDKRGKAWEKEHLALLKPFGARQNYDETEIPVTPSSMAELHRLLAQWRKEGAHVNGYQYCEELIDGDQDRVEWFTVEDRTTNYEAFENWGDVPKEPIQSLRDYFGVRPDRVKSGVHIVAVPGGGVFVSERFKSVVETNRLKGMDFLWCRDLGKYRANQWYLVACSRCLGRGLDAAWIDLTSKPFKQLDPRARHGFTTAYPAIGGKYKPDAGPKDPDVVKLLRLLRSMELLKRGPEYGFVPRFLRDYVPKSDFGFTIKDYGSGDDLQRSRGLALNRKAHDLLSAKGLIGEDCCKPLMIVERPPRGVENLDRRYGPVDPVFSAKDVARLRELEAEAWALHLANPKPPRAPDLDRSLKMLRMAKRRAPKKFGKPASQREIDETARELGVIIPPAWQKVLRLANGGRIDNCPLADGYEGRITPTSKLAQEWDMEHKYYSDIRVELPKTLLTVMTTEFGDSIWLDTSRTDQQDDCRVILMNHETGAQQREWGTVAEFLEEALTPQEKGEE